MDRTVTPELLDILPAEDSRAQRSRQDLQRINRLMGNGSWWRNDVAREIREDERVLEVGAGDAGFPLLPSHRVDGLDTHPAPDHWPGEARWHCIAAQCFNGWSDYTAVVGNLVFHHFTTRELHDLGAEMNEHCRVIAACEPRRARRFQVGFGALASFIASSDVTHHDALVSIAAGFRDDELPRALGLEPMLWDIRVDQTFRGAYRMLALRRGE